MMIYLSGIDGCGKTTQAERLTVALKKRGIDASYIWLRWEPSLRKLIPFFRSMITPPDGKKTERAEIENRNQDNWLKNKRKIFSNPFVRNLWWVYACADYYLACQNRLGKVDTDILVADRYLDDFIIDQAINFSLSSDEYRKLSESFFLRKFKSPAIRIIIDLPAQEAYIRKHDGTSLSYLEKREPYYKAIPGIHLNGMNDIDSLAKEIETFAVHNLLKTI
jgi:thymidylate kinase